MLNSENVFQQFSHQLENFPKANHYIVGFSGGLDSSVLLHLMKRWCDLHSVSLSALHIHHGLHHQADHWEHHCQEIAKQWSIHFISHHAQVKHINSFGLEAAARHARYEACKNYLKAGEILLFAHHAQDQAETVLLQLMRGSGLRGLSAMPLIRRLGLGFLARPLLNMPRDVLENYAQRVGIDWIEDHSNQDIDISRNYLRKEIFPLFKIKWPNVVEQINKSAHHCADTQNALDHYFFEVYFNQLKYLHILPYEKIKSLSMTMQLECIRSWIHFNEFRMPPEKQLDQFLQQVQAAASDRFPYLTWDDCEMRRYKQQIYLMKKFEAKMQPEIMSWNFTKTKKLEFGACIASEKISDGTPHVYLHHAISQVDIQYRKGGEVMALRNHFHHELKQIWQEYNVPVWWRDVWPLIYYKNELIGVLGLVLAKRFQAEKGETAWHIDFKPHEMSHEFRMNMA